MKQVKKTKRPKARSLAGYRLHDKKISQTARSGAIRTIKYELRSKNPVAEKRLAESVLHDYVHLYGPLGLYAMKQFGDDVPNIVDLWFSFLRRGGVFQPDEEQLYALGEIRSGDSGPVAYFMDLLGIDLLTKLDYVEEQLSEFLKSIRAVGDELGTERAAKKLRRSFLKIEEYCKDNGKNFIDLCKIIDPAGESKGNVQNWFPEVINFFVGHRKEFPSRPSNKVTAKELKSLTAVLIPELEIQQGKNKHDDMELIIVSRKNWLEKHGIIPKDSLIDNLIGINTGMNALSHFLSRLLPFLSDKDENQKLVLEAMDQRIHYTDVERIQVRNNLSAFSQSLENLPAPKAISGKWGNYRSDFNGTIASWVANNVRRSGEIKELIPDLIFETELISNEMLSFRASSLVDNNEVTQKEEFILEQLNEFQLVLDEMKRGGYVRLFPIYRDQITLLRDEINVWGQHCLAKLTVKELKSIRLEKLASGKPKKGDEAENQWYINKAFPRFSKDLPEVPVFFGENKRIKIQKHRNSLKLIKAGFEYSARFIQLLSQKQSNVIIDTYSLEQLRKCYAKCTTRRKNEVKTLLKSCLDEESIKMLSDKNARFYVTGFERNKTLKVLNPKSFPTLDQVSDLLFDVMEVAQSVHKDKKDWDLQIDTLEMIKTIFAIHLKNTSKCEPKTALTSEVELYFKSYTAFVDIVGDNTKPESINRNLQRFLFSEMRGAIQQAAKTKAICRSAIQSTNGEQGSVLVTKKTEDKKTISNGQMLEDVHSRRFYYSMDIDGEIDKVDESQEFLRIKKSKANATTKSALTIENYKVPSGNEIFEIWSSKHQIQFLRWLCEKPKKKVNQLALQGGFVIAEHEYELIWNSDLDLEVKLVNGPKRTRRTFVSLPFSIVPQDNQEAKVFNDNRLVGVDVGEYGLAVSAIEVINGQVKVLDQVFLNDPQYRALQKEVNIHRKDRQVRATANQVTTRIARLRESVIGSYRNQLHQLSLKHQGRLVFENEISHFEIGGQQIKKIYASIKQADVYSQIDAHKMTVNHTWGKWKKDGFKSGVEIGAAGTSRMCTCCNRWADTFIDPGETYKVQRIEGFGNRLGKVELAGKIVMVAELKNEVEVLSGKELNRHMYKFMRPPMVDPDKPSFAVQYRIDVHSQQDLHEQVAEMTNRGNQALYLCPYEDCKHFSDADLQASFTIALKRYLRELNEVEGYYDRNDWVEQLLEFCKQNDVPKIGVRPQKR